MTRTDRKFDLASVLNFAPKNKLNVATLALVGALLAPGAAFAGWGSIACDVNGSGACGASAGWQTPGLANWSAINACRAGGYNCYIADWEHNMCVYGPNGSHSCN